MRTRHQKGFTLIELMIVVAIVAILAAIAIPQYQNFTIRSQVTEGMSLASGLETKILDYYNSQGSMPANNAALGYADSTGTQIQGKYVASVASTAGVITVTFGNSAASALTATGTNTLALNPGTNAGGDVVWYCGKTAPSSGITPPSSPGSNTVSVTYLPKNCSSP
jgi:type IV pilus assembly protein PilA